MQKIPKAVLYLTVISVLSSCATLGSKTIFSSYNKNEKVNISKVYITKPFLINVDFYKESVPEFYIDELSKIFNQYNIEIIKSDSLIDFDKISIDNNFNLPDAKEANIILCGKIVRLTAMGMTRDYKVEYKILDSKSLSLKYHNKFSTTFGQTYVMVPGSGLPSEEQILRDAIKSGMKKIENDILKIE